MYFLTGAKKNFYSICVFLFVPVFFQTWFSVTATKVWMMGPFHIFLKLKPDPKNLNWRSCLFLPYSGLLPSLDFFIVSMKLQNSF